MGVEKGACDEWCDTNEGECVVVRDRMNEDVTDSLRRRKQ